MKRAIVGIGDENNKQTMKISWNSCRRWYQNLITRSRNLGILLIYHTNLWKYNSQKALDNFLHGRQQQTRHIPFMITGKMRKSLSSLGYNQRDIDKMTPSEATNVINLCIRKSTKALPSSEIQKD